VVKYRKRVNEMWEKMLHQSESPYIVTGTTTTTATLMAKDDEKTEGEGDRITTLSKDQEDEGKRDVDDVDDLRNMKSFDKKAKTESSCGSGGRRSGLILKETCSKISEEKSSVGGGSNRMRIAVVRPLVREENFDETISTHPLNTNSSQTSSIHTHPHVSGEEDVVLVTCESSSSNSQLLLSQRTSPTASIRTDDNRKLILLRTSKNSASIRGDDELSANNNNDSDNHSGKNLANSVGCDRESKDRFCTDLSHARNDDDFDVNRDFSDNINPRHYHHHHQQQEKAVVVVGSALQQEGRNNDDASTDSFGIPTWNASEAGTAGNDVDCEMKTAIKGESATAGHKNESVLNKSKRELRRSVSTCVMSTEASPVQEYCGMGEIRPTFHTSASSTTDEMKSSSTEIGSSTTLNMKNAVSPADTSTSAIDNRLEIERNSTTALMSTSKMNGGTSAAAPAGASGNKPNLKSFFRKSMSFDGRLPSSSSVGTSTTTTTTFIPPRNGRKSDDNDDDYDDDGDDDDDDDTCSIATSTNTIATASDASPRVGPKPPFLRKKGPFFPRTKSQRLKVSFPMCNVMLVLIFISYLILCNLREETPLSYSFFYSII
jgi:hypothetical protein